MSPFKVVYGYKLRNHVSLFLMFSNARVFESDEFFAYSDAILSSTPRDILKAPLGPVTRLRAKQRRQLIDFFKIHELRLTSR